MYQVSRTSVRQALRKLSSLGLVEVKVGGGTFIKETAGSQVMDKLILHTFLQGWKKLVTTLVLFSMSLFYHWFISL